MTSLIHKASHCLLTFKSSKIKYVAAALSLGALILLGSCNDYVSFLPYGSKVVSTTEMNNPDVLRGYGKVNATFRKLSMAGSDYDVWTFKASNLTNASTVAGKLLGDIDLSPGVKRGKLEIQGVVFPLLTVEGGAIYTGFAYDDTGCVISAKDVDSLKMLLHKLPMLHQSDFVTNLKYPQYLDRFDRYGWGFYGFSGEGNVHGWKKLEPNADPIDDMDFLAKHNFRFELWPQPAGFDDNYSVSEWPEIAWQLEEAAKRGVPMSSRLYGDMPTELPFTESFEQPAPFVQGGWLRKDELMQRSRRHHSWFHKETLLYLARQVQDQMKRWGLTDRPDIGSWMSPFGELYHNDWYNYHADYSPAAVTDWRESLRSRYHVTLEEASKMYNRQNNPFTSWDQVGIPEIATFAGLPGLVKDLEGDWYVRAEVTEGEGLKGEWWKADVSASQWVKMHLPGSVLWYLNEPRKINKWVVRDFKVTQEELSGKALYLYNFAKIFGDPYKLVPVYINGVKVGEFGDWGAVDVTKYLKAGNNRIAIQTESFAGRVFLSTDVPSVYPYLGPDRNRLWVIYNDWLNYGKFNGWQIGLAAMREVDPNRPIKFMAPIGFGTDVWLNLSTRFGGWPHFTGEGMWYFPWYKRYGFLYGLPGTSEGAGPADNVKEQVDLYQRVFLEGLNGHDQVFFVQRYTRTPELKKWYEEHVATLKQMGRYDISGPQVLIFRSTNQATKLMPAPKPDLGHQTREIQTVWNWDIGRSTLQSIGQSYLYVDDGGVADGKMAGFPIMVDSGNEIMTEKSIEGISKWVQEGGTFVTWPFTGRCSPESPDGWPIQKLTGCKVKTVRKPGNGSVTIEKNQGVFKELAGKTFPDNGSCKDWQDFEHNLISTELEAGSDCEVLAKFENGAPAIVSRKFGKGRVISIGSAFFRACKDTHGLWLSEERESVFFRDLLNGLGLPAVNDTSDLRVFSQRYRTNNGLDEVVVLVNFADGDRTVQLRAALERPPTKVYVAAMNSVDEVKNFNVKGNEVTIPGIKIPKGEVQVYYFRQHAPEVAVQHWWAYQQKIWRSTEKTKIDFSPISRGKWIDPTVDLKDSDWKWTQDAQASDSWTKEGFNDQSWKKWKLDLFNAVGADATKALYARRTFTVPAGWLKDKGITRLVTASWDQGRGFAVNKNGYKVYLNGQLLSLPADISKFNNPDVSNLLKQGENTVAIVFEPVKNGKYIGAIGAAYLTHSQAYEKAVNLAGEWIGTLDNKPVILTFPGKGKAISPTRKVHIPAEWKDKYQVTYYAKGTPYSTVGVIVNETGVMRRHHHLFGDEVEVDITNLLKFGEENSLAAFTLPNGRQIKEQNWEISQVELHLYPISPDYSNAPYWKKQ